ncbi:MAG: hypothetical protein GY806_01800 [Gammaproteobacteria bacterium]|nr:hypothetical protein [Gammaproteobacteria bacterium]
MNHSRQFLLFLVTALLSAQAFSHHVLGRPSYSLNEDSNTPPSMNIETQIGNYFVTAMVYPAFPKPNEAGRIHFYAAHLDNGEPLNTDVTFRVKDDSWFSNQQEKLGAQVLDDSVYRQGFVFQQEGNYIITAEFVADNQAYSIDFPMSVGNPLPVGPLGIAVGIIVLVLITVSIVQRKRLTRAKIQSDRPSKPIAPE